MSKRRWLYYKRAFLNKPRWESTGLVLAKVSLVDDELDAHLTIGDCSRQVTLDFAIWKDGEKGKKRLDKTEVANLRFKSAVFGQAVGDFLDAVEEGLEILEAD